MSGSKQTQTTSQQSAPWSPAQPGLQELLTKAQSYGNNPALFTPTFSQNTTSGLAKVADVAQQPSESLTALRPLVQGSGEGYKTALDALTATANGSMLKANPFLDEVLRNASDQTANTVNQQFSAAGRYGSGAHTGALAKTVGELQTNARMQQFNAERDKQLQAAGVLNAGGFQGASLAPGLDAMALDKAKVLFGAGQMQDQMDAAARQAPLAATDWQKQLTLPIASLGQQSTGTQTATQQASPLGMILGGLQTGLGLYTGLRSPPASGAGFGFG